MVNQRATIVTRRAWHGGKEFIKCVGALCPDGRRRTVRLDPQADTFFSVPGTVHFRGKSVRGFIAAIDESAPRDEGDFEFRANLYCKHGRIFEEE